MKRLENYTKIGMRTIPESSSLFFSQLPFAGVHRPHSKGGGGGGGVGFFVAGLAPPESGDSGKRTK